MVECGISEERLSRYQAGELESEPEVAALELHLEGCARCRRLLGAHQRLEALLSASPSPRLAASDGQRLRAGVRSARSPSEEEGAQGEVLTMEEAAAFLKVSLEDLEAELSSLPVFEFAGRLRIRRQRLLEWIEEQERHHRSRQLFVLVQGGGGGGG